MGRWRMEERLASSIAFITLLQAGLFASLRQILNSRSRRAIFSPPPPALFLLLPPSFRWFHGEEGKGRKGKRRDSEGRSIGSRSSSSEM